MPRTGVGATSARTPRSLARFLLTVPSAVWILVVWAIAVLPNLSVQAFRWEEGTNASLARDILARGDPLEPELYGVRFVEKPSLLPWLIAGTARLTGKVDEWSARLPATLAVLGTALLVQRLTRQYAGTPAALFAAAAFMFCPLVLRKLGVSEPDTLIAFLSFAAFVVWWTGESRARVTIGRWLACGGLLAVLAMAKGPQPVGFFALGVGGYLVVQRRWAAVPGFLLCLTLPAAATIAWAATVYRTGDFSVWFTYLRLHGLRFNVRHYLRERLRFAGVLPIDLLPGTLVLPPLLISWWRRSRAGAAVSPILLPLVLYAGLCTLALFVWPGTKTRYAMPVVPAVAVMAGVALESLWRQRHWAGTVAPVTAVMLCVYQVVLVTVVRPLSAESLGRTRRIAAAIDATVAAAPAPLLLVGWPPSNRLFYVKWPIHQITLPEAPLPAPAWILAPRAALGQIEALHPDLEVEITTTLRGPGLLLARIERRPGSVERR